MRQAYICTPGFVRTVVVSSSTNVKSKTATVSVLITTDSGLNENYIPSTEPGGKFKLTEHEIDLIVELKLM